MSTANVVTKSSYSAFSVYLTEARFEFLRMLRMPTFALPALIFPGMFYTLFGVLMGSGKGCRSAYCQNFSAKLRRSGLRTTPRKSP